MSFLKSLTLAIIATLFLTYVLGIGFVELLGINVYMEGELIEPLKAISMSALVVVILVLVALGIVLSVFGSLIFIVLLCLGSLAMVFIGFMWPILFMAVAIWLLTRHNKQTA